MQTEINTERQNIAQSCLYVGSKIVRLFEEEHRMVGGGNREMLVKAWASQVVLMVKNPSAKQETEETQVRSLGQEDPLEKGMAAHSSIFAWRIPWTEKPGRLQSTGSQRVGHD